MSAEVAECFICGEKAFARSTPDYLRCLCCGHEILSMSGAQGYIVNDPLDIADARRMSKLDRFKANLLVKWDDGKDKMQLLDIGSASGKFIFHQKDRYCRVVGIEITPAAVEFSRAALGLSIYERLADVPERSTMVTAWHSLEHMPADALLEVLSGLGDNLKDGGRFLVSVPNAASRQFRWFGRDYAYYDVPNHFHQFSPKSLRMLLARFGFRSAGRINSTIYNRFGYMQGLLNCLTGTHNYLYYRLKRRDRRPDWRIDFAHLLLLPVVIPLGWVLGQVDGLQLESQGVLTECFEKKR